MWRENDVVVKWKSECFEKEGMTLHILVSLDGWMDRISDL